MLRFFEQIKLWLGISAPQDVEKDKKLKETQLLEIKQPLLDNFYEQSGKKLSDGDFYDKPILNSKLQEKLNSLQNGETLSLWPPCGEYAGSIIINHPMILDGQGATIWASKGPVVSIQSDNVCLRNLRIEVTEFEDISSPQEYCAILIKLGSNLNFDNVEVRGNVMGLPQEEGEWKYPNSLYLGQLSPGREYHLLLRIIVPVECQIVSDIYGIEFQPRKLVPGCNEIELYIEKLPSDTLINGIIFLVSSSLKRRISLTAHILSSKDEQLSLTQDSIVWEPEGWSNFVITQNFPELKAEDKTQGKEPNSTPTTRRGGNSIGSAFQLPNQESNIKQTVSNQEQLAETSAQATPDKPLNPIFNNSTITPDDPHSPDNISSASDDKPSQPINPLFEQTHHPNQSSDAS